MDLDSLQNVEKQTVKLINCRTKILRASDPRLPPATNQQEIHMTNVVRLQDATTWVPDC